MRLSILAFTILGLTTGAFAANENNDFVSQTTDAQGLGMLNSANDDVGCYWGGGTAPICKGKCEPGWRNCGKSKTGLGKECWTGWKVYCCPGNYCPA